MGSILGKDQGVGILNLEGEDEDEGEEMRNGWHLGLSSINDIEIL